MTVANKTEIQYREGTWIAIPLRDGKYGIGRVTRFTTKGLLVVYFFSAKFQTVPKLCEVSNLLPGDAIRVARVGDLGLLDGSWKIIGDSDVYHREQWRTPAFIRRDDLRKIAHRVEYDDTDPGFIISEIKIPYDTEGLERASVFGSEAAQIMLSRLLGLC